MRLEVVGSGYQSATDAFVDANQLSAICFSRLHGRLASYAGMAGDDSTSQEFAAAYDDGGREALSSLAELVDSFAGLGRLTTTSLANHTRANLRSIAAGATVYDGGDLPAMGDASYLSVLPATPPSSLGADSPLLPDKVGWILDHVEGFVWPGADVDRLRDAAGAWRAAATGLDGLLPCCESAISAFWDERSPEIPLAIDATRELRDSARGLADQYAALGAACDSYADAVEGKRAEILHLAEWLLEQVVEGVVISVALGVITGGAGTAAGLSAVAARVAAESPRFTAILEALRALASGVAASVRAAREALLAVRVTLTKFGNAAVARSLARGEAGTLKLWWEREPGWLLKHEHSGSHTIAKHVGKTDGELLQRLRDQPWLKRSSSFTDQRLAESELSRVLAANDSHITDWLGHGKRPLELNATASRIVGRCALQGGTIVDTNSFRAVLLRDASMPQGYRILTAYPTP